MTGCVALRTRISLRLSFSSSKWAHEGTLLPRQALRLLTGVALWSLPPPCTPGLVWHCRQCLPDHLLGEGAYKTKCSFQTGFRVLLLTSVTWMLLAGSGLPRLAPFRKLKRCSLCGPGSRGVPEADRMPSMQYGSLKPGTQ